MKDPVGSVFTGARSIPNASRPPLSVDREPELSPTENEQKHEQEPPIVAVPIWLELRRAAGEPKHGPQQHQHPEDEADRHGPTPITRGFPCSIRRSGI